MIPNWLYNVYESKWSFRINSIPFKMFRGPLFHKPVTGQELFFAVSYSKLALAPQNTWKMTENQCICNFMVNFHKKSWMVSVTCASSYERNFPQSVCIGTFWCFDHGGFVDISSISPRIAQRHQKNTKLSTKQSETRYCCRQPGLGTKLKYI